MKTLPATFEIEIDRDAHCRQLRRQYFLASTICCALLGVFIGCGLIEWALGERFDSPQTYLGLVSRIAVTIGGALGIGFIVGVALYRVFLRSYCARAAANFSAHVEGAFLVLRSGWRTVRDRRIHFRSIIDYSTIETSFLRKMGVKTIAFSTPGAQQGTRNVIPAVRDADRVRDLLAEVDAAREG